MDQRLKMLLRTALLAALTAVGAFLRIPLGEISFTLQVMFSVMAGLMLKEKWGTASQAVYVFIGLIGVPVFTEGGGLSYIFQPSFGFLIGLIPLAFVCGLMTKNDTGFLRCAAAGAVGLAVLYAIGLPYMYLILNYYIGKEVSVWYVLFNGMIKFLPFDAVKIVIAAFTANKLKKLAVI